MTTHKSTVSEASVLRQAVLNTSSSIELLREALSNSVDADARHIAVKLTNVGGDVWNIVIEDDGNGMEDRHMKAFFNAGETVKDFPASSSLGKSLSIGEKGLGSKTSFVAKDILVESVRKGGSGSVLVGRMSDPMSRLQLGDMPEYSIDVNPAGYQHTLVSHGTRIELSNVYISTFNGKRCTEEDEIADRVMHYFRSMCATGTVKNRHAHKTHVMDTVFNVGVIPMITLEVVTTSGVAQRGPEPGSYKLPVPDTTPSGGPVTHGVTENSKNFCDVRDFEGVKTIAIQGRSTTVHYDGTAIVAGEAVRADMLKHELKQGWTQKSQMGLHLCKDFIPLRSSNTLGRELLGGEWYFEYKVFLNCQTFELNADRNVVTNEESDEIAWIWEDFKSKVWPQISAMATPYEHMKRDEDVAITAAKKTQASAALKNSYSSQDDIAVTKVGVDLKFVKVPQKEADASHLLAMMVQSGSWTSELAPVVKFGRYIDDSTDVLVEDGSGQPLLAEIELQLPNLFRHKHPMDSYDLVVVWSLGGMSNGSSQTAPWGASGATLPVTLVQGATGEWHLKWGTHNKRVVVLSELL